MKKRVLDLLVALAIALSLVAVACGPTPEPQAVEIEKVVTQVVEVVEPEVVVEVVEPEVVLEVTALEVGEVVVEVEGVAPTPMPPAGSLTVGQYRPMPDSRFCTLAASTGTEGFWLRHLSTATLLSLNQNLQWEPDLAGGYDVSDDGLSVIFYLRDDVTWHDGQPFTASDVVFTFDLILDPEVGGYYDIFAGIVSAVTAVDDYTVTFSLMHPVNSGDFGAESAWRSLVAGWTPVPAHLLQGTPAAGVCNSDWAQSDYIGLGPYRLVWFVPDEDVHYEPYSGYYGYQGSSNPNPFDYIEIYFIPEWGTVWALLQMGDVDMAQISPSLVGMVENDPDLMMAPDTAYIAVNVGAWPLADPYVGRALLEPAGETFVPYWESLSEVANIIGAATLLPQHPETEVAIQDLELSDVLRGVRINKARTVTLPVFREGITETVHLAPFGPESAPANAAEFWSAVVDQGEYVIGTFVVAQEDSTSGEGSAKAYAVRVEGDQSHPVVRFVPPDGGDEIVVTEEDIDVSEPDPSEEPLEIPIAAINTGSRDCEVDWDWIHFRFSCWW